MAQEIFCPTCGGLIFSSDPDAMQMQPCKCVVAPAKSSKSAEGSKSVATATATASLAGSAAQPQHASVGHGPAGGSSASRSIMAEDRPDPIARSSRKPAASDIKRCCNCAIDVSGKKRMKDSVGQYWCYECGKKDERARQAAEAAIKPATSACALCGTEVMVQNLIVWDGRFICPKCHREQKELAAKTEARIGRINSVYEKTKWQRLTPMLLVLGILFTIIILRRLGILGT